MIASRRSRRSQPTSSAEPPLNRGEWAPPQKSSGKASNGRRRSRLRHPATALFMTGNTRDAHRGFEDVVRRSPEYPPQYSPYLLGQAGEPRTRSIATSRR